MASTTKVVVRVDGATVSGVLTMPDGDRAAEVPGFVLAHGAQNDLSHPLLETVAAHLAASGSAATLRFNFPYAERGSSSPDKFEVLAQAFRRAHDHLVDNEVCLPGAVFLGGKSLGARVAAELVSRHHEGEGLLARGLVFLGYPLHAPGRKDRLRKEHLRRIDIPALFVEGTRDPFCDLELLRPIVAGLDHPGELLLIEGGGHSYETRRRAGQSNAQTYLQIAQGVADFFRRATGAAEEAS